MPSHSYRLNLVVPSALAMAAAALLWLAPLERTLGAGIKYVYVHVALTWTGLLGLLAAALLGLALLITGRAGLAGWAYRTGWVGLGFYAAGLGLSVLAAHINWGGVLWDEPRMRAALQTVALWGAAMVVAGWGRGGRYPGGLYGLVAAFSAWSTHQARLVLHPDNPISTSTSPAIQLTFLVMFGLSSLAAAWCLWHLPWPAPAREN